MRTTINLDDEVLRAARNYADARSVSLGKAVSELIRRGITAIRPTRTVNGLQVFVLPDDSPIVTSDTVKGLEAE